LPKRAPAPVTTPKRRGRILLSLLLLLLVVGVVPLLWTSSTLVSRSRDMLELDQKTIQLDKARSLSQQISVYVRSLHDQVQTISRTLALDADVAGMPFAKRLDHIRDTKALVRFVNADSPLSYVGVADASGRAVAAGIQLREPEIDMLLSEGVSRGLAGQSMISHPVISRSMKEPLLVIAEPVKPEPKAGDDPAAVHVDGVVLGVGTLAPLWKMAREIADCSGSGCTYEVYVVDERGHLVAHSDPNRLEGELDVSQVEIVKYFVATGGVASSTVPFTQPTAGGPVQMLGTFTKIPDEVNWGVIVQIPVARAYYSVEQMRKQSLLLVAGVTAMAVLMGFLFAGRITKPIQELARVARRLASGDYGTRVNVRSSNEVGVLGDAFNQMGEEIQHAIVQIQKAASLNKELFMGSIKMLANAIDEKDPYTRGHSERVAYYSMVIARYMGMSEEEVERVYLSGIIHDVGKIGIEDKILRKPAALTDEEYEIMKQHPTKGAHILDAVPALKAMAGAGLQHHENLDGSGYPDGLKGDQIPLLGRMVSVADAFDAMTTDRPYSKAMTFEAALARLRFLAGKKFDPECVTAMEKAGAAGDLSAAKARRASVESRKPAAPATRAATGA
jgi:HD-GYP domain-containing protein (c-di-GMP phosphodiesterase class II)